VSLRLGPVELDAPFFQAGLAGYSDAAMRLVARRHGAPYAVTEAMLDQTLLRGGRGLRQAELDEADHPIAGQLMGSHPADIAAGARLLVRLGYDVIDVNLACPVKKIRLHARGGHLMAEPDEACAILDAVRQAVGDDRPCTVKLRRGTDESAAAEANFHRIFGRALELGYAGAVVHARTVEQKYIGPSRWPFLTRLVEQYGADAAARGCVLGGSGDVWSAADVFRMLRETGVRLVSVARGAIGNPWIFRQARALMAGDVAAGERAPTLDEQRAVLLEHCALSAARLDADTAGAMMRKFGIKFSRHHPRGDEVARAFIAVRSLTEWHAVLERHYGGTSAARPIRPSAAAANRDSPPLTEVDRQRSLPASVA
jgi:tRNA-dihydrouridine synthase B